MNKNQLKTLLETVPAGANLTLTFIPQYKVLSGEYTVLSNQRGRGKGGSRILSVKNLETGQSLSEFTVAGKAKKFGTPVSEVLLNVSFNNTLHGSTDTSVPNAYPRSEEAAVELRDLFKALGKEHEGKTISVTSTEPEFDGEWKLVSSRVSAGRYGQCILTLTRPSTGETKELWSYRHSGIVKEIGLVEEG